MATPTVYVICNQNCKFEGMTKEQILTAIAQAVETGEIKDVDAGFVQTIKTVNGLPLKFFVGEQSAYDELTEEEKNNLFAIITNDTTGAGIREEIEKLQKRQDELEKNQKNIFSVPTICESKKLESAGFYIISTAVVGYSPQQVYCHGLIYWDGVSVVKNALLTGTWLEIGEDGSISLWGGADDDTAEYIFYVSKVGV